MMMMPQPRPLNAVEELQAIERGRQDYEQSPKMRAFRNWVVATNTSENHVRALIGLTQYHLADETSALIQVAAHDLGHREGSYNVEDTLHSLEVRPRPRDEQELIEQERAWALELAATRRLEFYRWLVITGQVSDSF